MTQITTGFRKLLSHPVLYDGFQRLMGGEASRISFARNSIRVNPGDCVLDIGCGTAEIRLFLPNIKYWGFDISEKYITAAKEKYGLEATFTCKLLDFSDLKNLPKFDVVLGCGLVHHLDNSEAKHFFSLAKAALKSTGRLVTIDPCYAPGQSAISRLLVSYDRGRNVMDGEGYKRLACSAFKEVVGHVRHQVWIPYTHWIMECSTK